MAQPAEAVGTTLQRVYERVLTSTCIDVDSTPVAPSECILYRSFLQGGGELWEAEIQVLVKNQRNLT